MWKVSKHFVKHYVLRRPCHPRLALIVLIPQASWNEWTQRMFWVIFQMLCLGQLNVNNNSRERKQQFESLGLDEHALT